LRNGIGGILNAGGLTIEDSIISHNVIGGIGGGGGGGIYNFASGTVSILRTTISANTTEDLSGGAGILNFGVLSVTQSTISGNVALGGSYQFGGGVYNSGTATISNSTISGNSAYAGAGIYNYAMMTIRSSTVSDNVTVRGPFTTSGGPGGIWNETTGLLTIQNTIVARNRLGVLGPFTGPDVVGIFNSLGNNLVGDTTESSGWVASDVKGNMTTPLDPRLGPLADNGGPTMTHALFPGSPAIDAGNNTGAPSTDQRGTLRPRDGNGDGVAVVDIGAFELSLSLVDAVNDTATVYEDTTGNIINVLANDTGPAGSTLTVTAVTQPAHGTAAIGPGERNVLYMPSPNFVGADTFTYTISDGQGSADTATVTLTVLNIDTDFQGAESADVFLVRRDPSGANVEVFNTDTPTGTPIFSMPVGLVNFLTFETLSGDDRLIVDLVNGNPVPTGGIQYLGAGNGSTGDQLVVRDMGTSSAIYAGNSTSTGNGVVTVDGRNITLTGIEPIDLSGLNSFTLITPNAADTLSIASATAGTMQLTGTSGSVALSSLTVTNIATFIIDAGANDAGAGNDSLTVSTTTVVPTGSRFLQYHSGTGDNVLSVQAGTARIDSTVEATGTLNTTIADGARIVTHRFRQNSLSLGNGTRASVTFDGTDEGTSVLTDLNIPTNATLDLADNDLIVKTTPANKAAQLSVLYSHLKSGYSNGAWIGNGLISSAAQGNGDTTLSLVDNALLGLTQFSGQPVDANSLLVKYTYLGDIDLNGAVDADDLTVFANNFGRTSGATQVDGDIDFNGTVDADDLTVFANNFGKGAGAPLAASPNVVISLPAESSVERREMDPSSVPSSPSRASGSNDAWDRTTAKLRFESLGVDRREMEHASSRRAGRLHSRVAPTDINLLAGAIAESTSSPTTAESADNRLAKTNRTRASDILWTNTLWTNRD
jgi:hypothetical protein